MVVVAARRRVLPAGVDGVDGVDDRRSDEPDMTKVGDKVRITAHYLPRSERIERRGDSCIVSSHPQRSPSPPLTPITPRAGISIDTAVADAVADAVRPSLPPIHRIITLIGDTRTNTLL